MAGDASYNTPIYTAQGGAELHVSSNARLVVDAGGSVLTQGAIQLDLGQLRVISSTAGEMFSSGNNGYLSSASTPSYGCVSTTDRTIRVTWSSGSQAGVQFPSVAIPDDFTTANGIAVKLVMGAATTSATIAGTDVQFWAGLGQTESGTVTAAITSTAPAEYTVSIPASALVGRSGGGVWSVALVPGAHTQDPQHLYSARIEYTRSS